MFNFHKRNEVGELVIIVLDGEFNSAFKLQSHIILGCPSKMTMGDLKRRLFGVTGIPAERIMLLFCGQVLSNEKDPVPLEAFELSDAGDEDTNCFKARLCLSVLEAITVELHVDEDGSDDRGLVGPEKVEEIAPNTKHKRKHKDKGEFNLEVELASIDCNAFAGILVEAGYDNEVWNSKPALRASSTCFDTNYYFLF